MSFRLECRKMKRTGFILSFLCGGFLAAAVPLLNMAFRAEMYLSLSGSPVLVLMDANWQMMALLNTLLVVAGACLMYHTEHADGAMQKMRVLPFRESRLFFGKFFLLAVMCAAVYVIEGSGMAFCLRHWFGTSKELWSELLKSLGYALLLMLPAALCSLFIASACRNMWVSLGIGVVCVFTATMLPVSSFALSLFPFALPFQIFAGTAAKTAVHYIIAAAAELLIIAAAEIIFLKVRRAFE